MAQQTANYGLHQWEPEDSFLRTDFNEDFQKIDGALGTLRAETDQKVPIACGTYQGNGTSQTITLGFRPKAVIVGSGGFTVVAIDGRSNDGVSMEDTGFSAEYGSGYETTADRKGRSHSYIAIR